MLRIRLSRIGKKKQPTYRLTIAERAKDPYGRSLEILGSYNPFSKELNVKKERIEYWLDKGASLTPTVNNLLIEKKIIKGEKIKASKNRVKKKLAEEKKPAAIASEQKKTEVKKAKEEEIKDEPKAEVKTENKKPDEEEKKESNDKNETENK